MLSAATKPKNTRPRRFLLRRKYGWIGIDVGTSFTKMAQVERCGGEYRISARWCLPADASSSLLGETQPSRNASAFSTQLRRARGVFRGKRSAAALSARFTTHRYVDLPFGCDEELRRMIAEEISNDSVAEAGPRCFDYWHSSTTSGGNNALHQLSVIDIDRSVSLTLANNLAATGLDCRLLDGIPCALARAVQMFDPELAETPQIILDLGYSSTVFVAAVQGTPVFARILRGCGLEAIIQPIQNSLSLTESEAVQLVRRMGLGPTQDGSPPDAAAHVVHQLVSEPVLRLMTEIMRTLSYLVNIPSAIDPKRILLSGGGAYLPALATQLMNETGLEVAAWRLPSAISNATNQDESLFAVAAALSALAWEQ